jgi:maltooligosyltrehalose trehalohydrolase
MKHSHRMPFGAEVTEDGKVRFRLWAPNAKRVEVCVEDGSRRCVPLMGTDDGWFEVITGEAAAGTLYRFQINGRSKVPDPASRFQPQDVLGPSAVIDSRQFEWEDDHWRGRAWDEAVIYELHVGTFTAEGTFEGIEKKLDYLCELGVTAIELMPVSDFPGMRNWGYDGVLPFAPDSSYGKPDDLKRLVQAAHGKGLMIFLDVVYNHFGPEGNFLREYAPEFFTGRHQTPWGDAINFDGAGSRVVRDFFIHNALYWLEEYRFDGLRLDAVHAIADESKLDILTELAEVVREKFGGRRLVHLLLENGDNEARYLWRDSENQVKLYDAQWNDDIHHALHVATTGETDGYYADFANEPIRLLGRCLTEGFAFQAEFSDFHGATRGEPYRELPLSAFISFLQNHDQVGNRAFGERILKIVKPRVVKAAMEILLLAPSPALLFMGEEFGATTPFFFFCDFKGDLAAAVTEGRRNEFAQFRKFSSAETRDQIPDPNAEETFLRSKLDWGSAESPEHGEWLGFYRNLLSIRRQKIVPLMKKPGHCRSQFVVEDHNLAVDWEFGDGSLLELRANLGAQPGLAKAIRGERFYASPADNNLQATHLGEWLVVWSRKL